MFGFWTSYSDVKNPCLIPELRVISPDPDLSLGTWPPPNHTPQLPQRRNASDPWGLNIPYLLNKTDFNGNFKILKWRYLPYIRPM